MSEAGRRNGICPFCGGASRPMCEAYDRNRETTPSRFAYNRCQSCESVFLVDVPADLSRYYGGEYYGFRPDGEADWQGSGYLEEFQSYRVELLLRHVQPGPLVEIGAGTGAFAAFASDAGFHVTAIEMDRRSCEYIEGRLGITAINSEQPLSVLAGLPPARVIALWHVLEHLPDPAAVLAAAAQKLEPGGILALGVPNPSSLQFRLLRTRWAHLDAPRHVTLIPPAALLSRASELGLECVEMTTDDPFGRHCNMHGWCCAVTRRPARGFSPLNSYLGLGLRRVAAPYERRGLHGSALLVLFRRKGAR